jgi:transketolase
MSTTMDELCVNTIRTLAMDAVQRANSGHPGTPMALAPVVYCLWQRVLRFDPGHPIWPNRDRFVLSAGHASMLLYALLHVTGVRAVNPKYETLGQLSVTLEDIKRFRQLDSKCPGHPEYRWTSGVETTTGPLGQGVATSVGMAIAERWLASYFNRPGFDLFDYDVYALCGDGCLMEGISGEAASLAGHLKLANLCWIYDNNHITIEGNTALAYSDDVATRFIGYGWNVTRVGDANDLDMLERAFQTFKHTTDRPTLVIVDSHIAYGAPHKQDTSAAHGEPLGGEEIRLAKRNYGWPEDAEFLVPEGVREHFGAGIGARGQALHDVVDRARGVQARVSRARRPRLGMSGASCRRAGARDCRSSPRIPKACDWRRVGPDAERAGPERAVATGGSRISGLSCKTRLTFDGAGDFTAGHRPAGICTSASGSTRWAPCSTACRCRRSGPSAGIPHLQRLRARAAIRLSALMELPVIYIFTHDSIGVGEDGPTHQPVEQLAVTPRDPRIDHASTRGCQRSGRSSGA